MTITYLKKARKTAESGQDDVQATVRAMLDKLAAGDDRAARRFARDFDRWDGDVVVPADVVADAEAAVPSRLRDDIRFAHDNIRRFAEAQKATITDCELEIRPGFLDRPASDSSRQCRLLRAGRTL